MSLKEIQSRADRLRAQALQIANESDPSRIMEMGEQMRQDAAEKLERIAEAFQAKMDKESRRASGTFEVVLTPGQKHRVRLKHGVDLESVIISDSSGELNAAMVHAKPDMIEAYAMREAERRKAAGPAKAKAKAMVDNMLAELEGQSEQMAEKVRDLKQDPKFQKMMDFDKK